MIDEVDLGVAPQQRTVRVAICQIPLAAQQFAAPGKTLAPEALRSLETRLLRTLAELREHRPQVVQFPECSIPADVIHHLRQWSADNNCIVIGGTHYEEESDGFVSKCPVIFPDGTEFVCEKITISPLEKSPVPGKKVVPGKIRYMFRNTAIGDFLVLICADLLDPDSSRSISELNPDIVFVSAFQPDRKRYHSVLADLCINSRDGIYACYSNCVSPLGADGRSGLFAVTDRAYLSAFKEAGLSDLNPEQKLWEAKGEADFVVCDLDLDAKKPAFPKSALVSPNAHIIATRSLRAKQNVHNPGSHRLVAFDMDGTLLRGIEFSWTKLWELCGDDGRIWRGHLQRYLRGKLTYEAWCQEAVAYFRAARLDKDLIFSIARESATLTRNFAEGMNALRAAGLRTVLISGGVDIFLRALIPDYRKYFDQVFVNTLLFDSDDVVSGVNATQYDYEGKADALRLCCDIYGFDLNESVFVGDRFNDKHAIEVAGHAILYSDSKDGVKFQVDHVIEADDFLVLANYILSR
jgi:HAD superfamily phosphoserine phosphatase-like hydrolase